MKMRLRWLLVATLAPLFAFSVSIDATEVLGRQIADDDELASSTQSAELQRILETVIAERLFAHLDTQYRYDGTYNGKQGGKQQCPPLPRQDQDQYLPRMPSIKCGLKLPLLDQYVILQQFERPDLKITEEDGVRVAIKLRVYVRIRKTNCQWRDCGDDRFHWTSLHWRGSFAVDTSAQDNIQRRFRAKYEYGDIATDSNKILNIVLDIIEFFCRDDVERILINAINYTYRPE